MDTFRLSNNVRLRPSHALLLLYRYLTDIYTLGDLSLAQFLGGYLRGEGRRLEEGHVLTVSGNGIGELQKMLSLQWQLGRLDIMAVSPRHMQIMRLLLDANPEEACQFFGWARRILQDYPNLQELLNAPGLATYWQQQVELWQSAGFKSRARLLGGSPWDLPAAETYDAIILSHAQRLLQEREASELLTRLNPGGLLASLTPISFRPDFVNQKLPARFADAPMVVAAKQKLLAEAQKAGYAFPTAHTAPLAWPAKGATSHVVSFSIASPLRSLLVGELLISSLDTEVPEETRLALLETALAEVSPAVGAGAEALLILVTEKGGA